MVGWTSVPAHGSVDDSMIDLKPQFRAYAAAWGRGRGGRAAARSRWRNLDDAEARQDRTQGNPGGLFLTIFCKNYAQVPNSVL